MIIQCDYCNNDMERYPSDIKKSELHFCSRVCYSNKRTRDLQDAAGKTFGHLLVTRIETASPSSNNDRVAICDCLKCGREDVERSLSRIKSGKTKTCGCSRWNTGADSKSFTGHKDLSGTQWAHMRKRARVARLDFTWTMQEAWDLFVKQDKKCALTGLDIYLSPPGGIGTASADRIDSSKGYVQENMQWLHKDVNMMKYTHSQSYFIKMCQSIDHYNKEEKNGH